MNLPGRLKMQAWEEVTQSPTSPTPSSYINCKLQSVSNVRNFKKIEMFVDVKPLPWHLAARARGQLLWSTLIPLQPKTIKKKDISKKPWNYPLQTK